MGIDQLEDDMITCFYGQHPLLPGHFGSQFSSMFTKVLSREALFALRQEDKGTLALKNTFHSAFRQGAYKPFEQIDKTTRTETDRETKDNFFILKLHRIEYMFLDILIYSKEIYDSE